VSPDLVYRTDEQLVDRDVLGLGHGVEHAGGDRSTLSSKPVGFQNSAHGPEQR
jgi:hypothetical protein